jgi:hypothetical protein
VAGEEPPSDSAVNRGDERLDRCRGIFHGSWRDVLHSFGRFGVEALPMHFRLKSGGPLLRASQLEYLQARDADLVSLFHRQWCESGEVHKVVCPVVWSMVVSGRARVELLGDLVGNRHQWGFDEVVIYPEGHEIVGGNLIVLVRCLPFFGGQLQFYSGEGPPAIRKFDLGPPRLHVRCRNVQSGPLCCHGSSGLLIWATQGFGSGDGVKLEA